MRVAVIGAGQVGVATAFELARDGHAVTVFERHGSVAEDTSFAHAGLLSPGLAASWAVPGIQGQLLRSLLGRPAPLRLAHPLAGPWLWLWQWRRAGRPPAVLAHRQRLYRLARYSQQRMAALVHELHLAHEQAQGLLVLLRTPRDLTLARAPLKLLADLGADFHLIDGEQARAIEPGLHPDTPLQAAVHLPGDAVGNGRQFAHLLRAEAQRLGASFRFQRTVLAIGSEAPALIRHQAAGSAEAPQDQAFDAVVVCAAMAAPALLRPLGLRLPLAPVQGWSITAPLRHLEGHPPLGPQGAVMDARHRVTISRLGARVRVTGGALLGSRPGAPDAAPLQALHRALDDWFPGCAQADGRQTWHGARPTLPDGPPVLGASGTPGVWLNLGHGGSGWATACGCARVLADQLAGRTPEIDVEGLDIGRFRH